MGSLFDLDDALANEGSKQYEKELRKAKLLILREEYDKALAIYQAILEEDLECLEGYIGLVRAYSQDYTIFDGPEIEKNIRIIDKIFEDIDDDEFLDYLSKRKKAKAEKLEAEEAERKKATKDKEEAEKRKYHIHLNLGGRWKDLILNNDNYGNYSIQQIELRKNQYFKISLDGDWRGYDDLKLSLPSENNFKSDGSPEKNIKVLSDGIYDIYVSKDRDGSGEYKGKSIWIERSDPKLRQKEEEECKAAEEEKRKKKASQDAARREKERQEQERRAKEAAEREKAERERRAKEAEERERRRQEEEKAERERREINERIRTGNIIPKGTTTLKKEELSKFKDAEILIIPESVRSIPTSIFKEFRNLREMTLPPVCDNSFAYIFGFGDSYFPPNLRKIIIRGGPSSIKPNGFSSTPVVETFEIGSNISYVKEYAFCACKQLRRVNLPNTIYSVEDGAFSKCESLTEITIPDRLNLGTAVFSGCRSLTRANIGNISKIPPHLFADTGLTSINIPNSVSSIGAMAFRNCPLTSVDIPEGVRTIDGFAFQGCTNLRSVTLPSSLSTLDTTAFDKCPNLTTIRYRGGMANLKSIHFSGSTYNLDSFTFSCNDGSRKGVR